MASYQLNDAAVEHTRTLIKSRQYVLDSEWGDAQPDAAAENAYLENHTFDDYAAWHLGLTEGATDDTKARYAFVVGDFRRVHRSALIACVYRAAEPGQPCQRTRLDAWRFRDRMAPPPKDCSSLSLEYGSSHERQGRSGCCEGAR